MKYEAAELVKLLDEMERFVGEAKKMVTRQSEIIENLSALAATRNMELQEVKRMLDIERKRRC